MKNRITIFAGLLIWFLYTNLNSQAQTKSASGFYIINTAAVKTQAEAKTKVAALQKQGYAASILWIPDYASLNGAPLYCVYIGPFKTQAECEATTEKYRKTDPAAYGLLVNQEKKRVQIAGKGKVTVTPLENKATAAFRIIKAGEGKYGIPKSKIAVDYNGKTTIVATVDGVAAAINKSDFAGNSIPKKAVAACSAWWAGSGDYFYLLPTTQGLALYQGWQDSQQEDEGFHWKQTRIIK